MGFFNNILLKEFVDYSLIFMRSQYSVGFSNIFMRIDGIMTEFVMLVTLDENLIPQCRDRSHFDINIDIICIHPKHPVDTLVLAFATPQLPRIEIFGVNALRGKLLQLGSPKL